MYVYIHPESQVWTVGFYRPDGTWEAESDHSSSEEAGKRVALLNGNSVADPLNEVVRQLENININLTAIWKEMVENG